MRKKLKIFIIDDQPLFREEIRSMMMSFPDFILVGQGDDYKSSLKQIKKTAPDLVIIDLEKGGKEVAHKLKTKLPSTKIVLPLMCSAEVVNCHSTRKGIHSFLTKETLKEFVEAAKHSLKANGTYFTEIIIGQILSGINDPNSGIVEFVIKKNSKSLTDRELDVIKLMHLGLTSQEIAEELCVDKRTIDTHRANIRKKLKVKNTARIIQYAIKHNLL